MDYYSRASILSYHKNALQQHGLGSVESLGWRGEDSQQLRFEAMAELFDFNQKSVLDLGCGYGDLLAFLDLRYEGFTYTGMDHMREFIDEADRLHEFRFHGKFLYGDFWSLTLPPHDVVVASGVFCYHHKDPGFLYQMIEKMFNTCHQALIFNFLDQQNFQGGVLISHNTKRVEEYCRTLTDQVTIHQGYLEDDVTVMMSR